MKCPLSPQNWGTSILYSPQNWGARGAKIIFVQEVYSLAGESINLRSDLSLLLGQLWVKAVRWEHQRGLQIQQQA
jgi:hypothetical protein